MSIHSPDQDRVRDQELTRQLEALLGHQLTRIRFRFLLHGLGILLFAAFGFAIIYYGVDRLLTLPPVVRILISAGLTAYVVLLLRRRLLYPLGREFTRNDVALALEQRFPELRQKLISAIQLGRTASTPEQLRNQSAQMIHKVLEDAGAHIQRVPHQQLLNPVQTSKIWAATAGVALVIVMGIANNPAATRVFLQRVFGFDTPYPRATNLFLMLPEGEEYQVERSGAHASVTMAAGGDLPVVVRVEGNVPKQVYMMVQGGRGMPPRIPATRRGENRFRHVFRRIGGSFSFFASGGDDPRGDLTVEVTAIQPPKVETIQAQITYPAYAGMPPATQVGGSVEALVGSRVQLSVATTQAVQEARIEFVESGRPTVLLTPHKITDDAGERTVYRGNILHTQSDRYQVHLVGQSGLTNPHPGTYQLLAVPDHAPVGTILAPENDDLNVVLPDGIIPLRIEALDDFGLVSATVQVQSDKANIQLSRKLFEHKPTAPPTKRRILLDFIDLAQPASAAAKATVGQTLLLATELIDNRDPSPNKSTVNPRQVYIIGETDLLRRAAGHFRRVREAVEQVLKLQHDRHERLMNVTEALEAGQALSSQQVAITAVEVAQGRIQSAAGRIHTDLMRAFDFHLFNRLDPSNHAAKALELYQTFYRQDPRAERFLAEFYRDLAKQRQEGRLGRMEILEPVLQMTVAADQVADKLAPKTMKLLAEARIAPGMAGAKRALTAAALQQTVIIKVLKELLGRLEEWNEFQDLIDNTRSLRDKQRDVQRRTRALQNDPKKGRKAPGEKKR